MEYIEYHGTYGDTPVDKIVEAWKKAYGRDRVEEWIKMFAQQPDTPLADFDSEDVWQA